MYTPKGFNIVRRKGGKRPLNERELDREFCKLMALEGVPEEKAYDYVCGFVQERINGRGKDGCRNDYGFPQLCDCKDGGNFILQPMEDNLVKNGGGGKNYMQCTKCGGWSHL